MNKGKHHIEALAALMLFALYALCILAVLFSGSGIFSRISERDDKAFTARTMEGYLYTKLRQSDFAGGIAVEEGSLILAGEQGYETRIYLHDGYICELFTRSDAPPQPEAGEKLLPTRGMDASMDAGIVRIELEAEGDKTSLVFSPSAAGEVSP